MTNDYKNELDWLRNNWPLLGRFEYKPDEAVHTTIGRVAELLYLHAFGTGRLGAAVSASPQPSVDIKQKCINFICQYPYPTWEQLVVLVESCFAAAPAQEPQTRLLEDCAMLLRRIDNLLREVRAQEQPVENSPCGAPLGSSGYLEVYCKEQKGHDNGKHESSPQKGKP